MIDRNCYTGIIDSSHYCPAFYRCWFFLVLIGLGILSGCYSAWVSQGQIVPSTEWQSHAVMASSLLSGQDIEIFLKVGNGASSSWDYAQRSPLFGISLWFAPKALDFEINPNQVFLQIPSTAVLSPARILMSHVGSNVEASGWSCYGNPKNIKDIDIKSDDKHVLRRGSCFEFYFDTTAPSPDAEFSMRIEGLARNGQKVAIPEIQFRKGSFKVMDFPFRP